MLLGYKTGFVRPGHNSLARVMFNFTDPLEATGNCMDLHLSTFFLETLHDVKGWILPHLSELHGHRDPHCFKFLLNEDNKINVECTTEVGHLILDAQKTSQ